MKETVKKPKAPEVEVTEVKSEVESGTHSHESSTKHHLNPSKEAVKKVKTPENSDGEADENSPKHHKHPQHGHRPSHAHPHHHELGVHHQKASDKKSDQEQDKSSTSKEKTKRSNLPGVKRRVGETHILAHEKGRTLSFSGPSIHHKTHLGPSVNPVKASIVKTSNKATTDFVVHYNRYVHSHQTVDSRHELHYKRVGFPNKPVYDVGGRRFSGSSEEDPDYNHEEFTKLALELNARKGFDSDSDEEDDTEHTDVTCTADMHKKRKTKVHPETNPQHPQQQSGCFPRFLSFCCWCCFQPKTDLDSRKTTTLTQIQTTSKIKQ